MAVQPRASTQAWKGVAVNFFIGTLESELKDEVLDYRKITKNVANGLNPIEKKELQFAYSQAYIREVVGDSMLSRLVSGYEAAKVRWGGNKKARMVASENELCEFLIQAELPVLFTIERLFNGEDVSGHKAKVAWAYQLESFRQAQNKLFREHMKGKEDVKA